MTKQRLGTLQPGAKVTYAPGYGHKERGIVKSFDEDLTHAFVVYNCAGNWDEYEKYTAARTHHSDLEIGWDS